ncbi:peptidoglycan-binding domain-containing protein [Streptomyces sp. NPDC048191]|uniref:peptidoglycan-binding domain-containing protein n=1 Tax=Streptomyces sp. NPDC048191 TaxID=3155484 RepID=UPI0033C68269
MTDSEGHACPECGAPRGPDRSPSCDCTERTAEALRETRSAEAAAAEDFDPLRIRPYVHVDTARSVPSAGLPSGTDTPPPPPAPAAPADAETRPLPAVRSAAGASAVESVDGDRRRSRRTVLLSVAGAGVAVVAVAGFASGLFSYQTPSRDGAAAQEVRESVPDVTAPGSTSPVTASASTTARPPVPSPSAPVNHPSPSATPSTSPTPSTSAETSRPASPTPSATTSATARTTPAVAPVLRRGDQGPEVTELQQRLRQLNLYGDRVDGVFTGPVEDAVRNYQLARGILGDTLGVYGPATRKSLESETREP